MFAFYDTSYMEFKDELNLFILFMSSACGRGISARNKIKYRNVDIQSDDLFFQYY